MKTDLYFEIKKMSINLTHPDFCPVFSEKIKMIKGTILIVDENRPVLNALDNIMQNEFEKVIAITDPNRINEILKNSDVGIVMLDMKFKNGSHNGSEGLFWMKEVFNYDSNISVVIVTASGDIELAVKAIREGAVDYILKPWDHSKLLATINAAWKLRLSRLEATC
jgi:DNA-binding NtrC family response regulator